MGSVGSVLPRVPRVRVEPGGAISKASSHTSTGLVAAAGIAAENLD